jgi:hypothetical protein
MELKCSLRTVHISVESYEISHLYIIMKLTELIVEFDIMYRNVLEQNNAKHNNIKQRFVI